jgi:Uma2 family endonuclease
MARLAAPLLWDVIGEAMAEQGRHDFFVCGNMFVYYSPQQAWDVARGKKYFRGPDVFWVDGVEPTGLRKAWVSWEEGGRLPDVIIELLSPSTAEIDRTEKKDLYAQVFQTAEYYMCDPETLKLEGLLLEGRIYRPITPDQKGRLWSPRLGAFLGFWHGVWCRQTGDWLRLFHPDGSLVPMKDERAEEERRRAEAERLRAEAAEAEVARLRTLLEGR